MEQLHQILNQIALMRKIRTPKFMVSQCQHQGQHFKAVSICNPWFFWKLFKFVNLILRVKTIKYLKVR